MFDPYTGQEAPEVLEEQQKEIAAKKVEEAEMIVGLTKQPGWKYITDLIKEDIKKDQDTLLFVTSLELMTRMQERIKARKDFLGWLEMKVAERDYLLKEQQARENG